MERQKKVERMMRIEHLEKLILTLANWKVGETNDLLNNKFGPINTTENRDKLIEFISQEITVLKEEPIGNSKFYLSDIVKKEKPKFASNNLILAPVGSGKTTLIEEVLSINQTGKLLMLVSNTALKDSVCPTNISIRKKHGKRNYTTQNKSKFGDKSYEMHVMSYAEFGSRIKYNDNFVKDINQIYCDEIHSLLEYQEFSNSPELIIATKYLFGKHKNKQIFYFTATDYNLRQFEKKEKDIFVNVTEYNYLNHPDIRRYMALSEYKINNIEQIRVHLEARLESFNYFGYKCLAFSRTISGQKRIEEIAIEEGFKPICIWSVNNVSNPMNEEQLKVREYLLTNGNIPEPYNFLIINSAMQEGWDLHDASVKLAIMNTINETEKIQALGRNRNDIDILIYRTKSTESKLEVDLDDKWLNIPLSTEMKNELCLELDFKDAKGETRKWLSISKILSENGYIINNEMKRIDGRRLTYTTISIAE